MIILLTESKCPNVIIEFYVKSILTQILIVFIVYYFEIVKRLYLKNIKQLNTFWLVLVVFLFGSFFRLWQGERSVYIYGGQEYCHLEDVPTHMRI